MELAEEVGAFCGYAGRIDASNGEGCAVDSEVHAEGAAAYIAVHAAHICGGECCCEEYGDAA